MGMPPRGDAGRLRGSSGQGLDMGRTETGRIQSREEEGEWFSSRKSSLGRQSLSQGCSREERGCTGTLRPVPPMGQGVPLSPPAVPTAPRWLHAPRGSAVPASPARPCRTPGPAGWSVPAAALPAAGRSGDKERSTGWFCHILCRHILWASDWGHRGGHGSDFFPRHQRCGARADSVHPTSHGTQPVSTAPKTPDERISVPS